MSFHLLRKSARMSRTRRFKPIAATALAIIVCLVGLPALCEKVSDRVTFSPAIFNCAKKFVLQEVSKDIDGKSAVVTVNDKQFDAVKDWIVKNLLSFLNNGNYESNEANSDKCLLFVLNKENGTLGDIIMTIPLTKNSLGPDYKARIKAISDLIKG